MVKEGVDLRALTNAKAVSLPTLAIERAGRTSTADALGAVHGETVRHIQISDVGRYISLKASLRLAEALMPFLAEAVALMWGSYRGIEPKLTITRRHAGSFGRGLAPRTGGRAA